MTILSFSAIVIAYLFGSISSAILVCRMLGLPDPRTQGSGNPGATNVLRLGGKKAAVFTLCGDLLKGLISVYLAKWIGFSEMTVALVMLAAFMGHLFPIFFRFEGGKGVATLLGCLLGLSWPVGFSWMITWSIVAYCFRYSSLAALIATSLAPLYLWFFHQSSMDIIVVMVMALILIYRHRQNLKRLLTGTESKIGK